MLPLLPLLMQQALNTSLKNMWFFIVQDQDMSKSREYRHQDQDFQGSRPSQGQDHDRPRPEPVYNTVIETRE